MACTLLRINPLWINGQNSSLFSVTKNMTGSWGHMETEMASVTGEEMGCLTVFQWAARILPDILDWICPCFPACCCWGKYQSKQDVLVKNIFPLVKYSTSQGCGFSIIIVLCDWKHSFQCIFKAETSQSIYSFLVSAFLVLWGWTTYINIVK